MIQGHECHDEAAQDVYGNDPCRAGGAHGNTSCRHWWGFNPLQGLFQMHLSKELMVGPELNTKIPQPGVDSGEREGKGAGLDLK
jgi:hypothetical protein